MCLLVSKALGATVVLLTDMMENRLEVAMKLGTQTFSYLFFVPYFVILGATATFKANDPELLNKVAVYGPITQVLFYYKEALIIIVDNGVFRIRTSVDYSHPCHNWWRHDRLDWKEWKTDPRHSAVRGDGQGDRCDRKL